MICKNCGTQILRGKFCAKCGTKISEAPPAELTDSFCASCKAPLKPGAKFCRTCGARYEPPPVISEEPVPVVSENPPVSEPQPQPVEPERKLSPPIPAKDVPSDTAKKVMDTSRSKTAYARPSLLSYKKKRKAAPDSSPLLKSGKSGNESGNKKRTVFIIIAAVLLVTAGGAAIGYFFPRNTHSELVVEMTAGEPPATEGLPADAETTNPFWVDDPVHESHVSEDIEDIEDIKETNNNSSSNADGFSNRPADPIRPPPPAPKQKENIQPKILPARLLVKTDPGNVYITLNGRQIGMTDDSGNLSYDGVTPGLHEVRAYAEGYDDATQNLQFTSGGQQEAQLTLTRLNGNLSVKVNVGNADIRISGAGILSDHNGHITALELPSGSYTVTVSKAGYRTVTGTADVQANGNRNISVTLEAIYSGPTSGVMVWEGDVRGPVMVTIEDGKASTGRVTGNPLPGVPCSIVLSDYKNAVIAYMPGRESDYKRVVLQVNSRGKVSVEMRWTVLQ